MNETLTAVQEPQTERAYIDSGMMEKEAYRPSNQEALREYEIKIQFLNRGCIVNVGCKSIAFEDVSRAMTEINEYVNNAYDSQKKWRQLLA